MIKDEEVTIADLVREIREMRNELTDHKASTKELVDAWKAAGGLLKFVKWISGIAIAVAGAWAVIQSAFGGR